MGYRVISSKKELDRIFLQENNVCYIVGAGQYGEMLGGYLNDCGYAWDGYIDRRGSGRINEKEVYPYSVVGTEEGMVYIVSSVANTKGIVRQLTEAGANGKMIFAFDDRQVVFDICSNSPSVYKGEYTTHSYGDEDPEKTYMVMIRTDLYEGPFSDASLFLRGCKFAEENGYIPVIDRIYYPSFAYQNVEHVRLDNAWEYYFEQPGGITIEDVIRNKKNVRKYVVNDSANIRRIGRHIQYHTGMGEEDVYRNRKLARKYIRLEKKLFDDVCADKIGFKQFTMGRVLGVSIRDINSIHIKTGARQVGGYVQPTIEEMIRNTSEKMNKWGCNYVYLSCEFSDTVELFRKEFGNSLLCFDRPRKCSESIMNNFKNNRVGLLDSGDVESKTRDYIRETYLLSECDALLCGWSSGSSMAVFLGECGLDRVVFFDDSVYSNM